jgi:integrase
VFSINDGASPFTSVGMAMDNLRALMPDIERWTLHDLRRSAATNLAKLEVPLHIIEKILNHQSSAPGSAIAAIYNRHSYDKEKREAMEKLAVKYQRFGCGERGLEHS